MENSKIQWTSHTFNAWHGCVEIGEQCTNCYAREMNARFHPSDTNWGVHARRRFMSETYWKQPIKWNADAEKAGVRRRVFAHSMSDWAEVLPSNHPDKSQMIETRHRLCRLIETTSHMDWLLLTKRIGNVKDIVPDRWMCGDWPQNAHLGISVGDQKSADRDIPKLLELPAPVKFLSIEPMLGEVDLLKWLGKKLHYYDTNPAISWVIAGGESGKNARPSHPDWFRKLRDNCVVAGVPFHFKQWGEWSPAKGIDPSRGDGIYLDDDGSTMTMPLGGGYDRAGINLAGMRKVGTAKSGRLLDGRTWDQFPKEFE